MNLIVTLETNFLTMIWVITDLIVFVAIVRLPEVIFSFHHVLCLLENVNTLSATSVKHTLCIQPLSAQNVLHLALSFS